MGAAPGRSLPVSIPQVLVTSHKYSESTLPGRLRRNIRAWQLRNPGFSSRYYNDAQASAFVREHCNISNCAQTYSFLLAGAAKADIFRIVYLLVNGGVWHDADLLPISVGQCSGNAARDARMLLYEYSRGAGKRHVGIRYTLLAAAPGHPVLRSLVLRLIGNIRSVHERRSVAPRNEALSVTGPINLFRTVREWWPQAQFRREGTSYGEGASKLSYVSCFRLGQGDSYKGYISDLAAMHCSHHKNVAAVLQVGSGNDNATVRPLRLDHRVTVARRRGAAMGLPPMSRHVMVNAVASRRSTFQTALVPNTLDRK